MIKKKTDQTIDIRKLVAAKKVVIGTKQTLAGLRKGNIIQVFVAKNCNEKTKETIDYYHKLNAFEIIQLDVTNEDLGVMCKKQFGISILGVLK